MTSPYDFTKRVALVAGGTGELGTAVTLAFASAGARVVATYRRREELDALLAAAARAGVTAPSAIPLDTSDAAAVSAAVADVAKSEGRIDFFVNAIGAYAGGKKVWEEDRANYDRMLGANLLPGFLLARAVLPVMISNNSGRVINIASRAGYGHSPGGALYSASKAAALALFDSLADEVKPYAINVNSVVPSIFDTSANRRAMPDANFALWPKAADIAQVILFLCSDQAILIHGAAIPVYGHT